MTSRKGNLENIRNRPNNVHHNELVSLLHQYGWILRKSRGNNPHDVYTNPEYPQFGPIPLPRHKNIKSCYVKQIIGLIDTIEAEKASIGDE